MCVAMNCASHSHNAPVNHRMSHCRDVWHGILSSKCVVVCSEWDSHSVAGAQLMWAALELWWVHFFVYVQVVWCVQVVW